MTWLTPAEAVKLMDWYLFFKLFFVVLGTNYATNDVWREKPIQGAFWGICVLLQCAWIIKDWAHA